MSVMLDTHQEFIGQPYSFPTSQLLLLGQSSFVKYRSIAERSSLRSAKHGRRGGNVVVVVVVAAIIIVLVVAGVVVAVAIVAISAESVGSVVGAGVPTS